MKRCLCVLRRFLLYPLVLVVACSSTANAQVADVNIAVWDFDNHALATPRAQSLDHLSRSLAELLVEQLLSYPGIRMIERSRLWEILDEQKLGSSALADEDTRLRLGRMAGAQHMIFGSLVSLGEVTRADVRVVSAQTSQVIFAQEASAKSDELAAAMVVLARDLASSLGHTNATPNAASRAGVSAATLASFDEGLALMDRKNFLAAIEVFKSIIAKEPGFAAAERQLHFALEQLTRQ